jgi:hypothetical protein
LRNIGKDAVHHADQHAVLEGMTRILDDGDDVCTVGSHVDQVTSGAVRELNGKDGSLGSDDIGNVRHTGAGRSTEVEDLAARAHVDVVDTTENTGCQFTPEGVPDAVLDAAGGGILGIARVGGGSNADALSPGVRFLVTSRSSFPRATKTPAWRWGSTITLLRLIRLEVKCEG